MRELIWILPLPAFLRIGLQQDKDIPCQKTTALVALESPKENSIEFFLAWKIFIVICIRKIPGPKICNFLSNNVLEYN